VQRGDTSAQFVQADPDRVMAPQHAAALAPRRLTSLDFKE